MLGEYLRTVEGNNPASLENHDFNDLSSETERSRGMRCRLRLIAEGIGCKIQLGGHAIKSSSRSHPPVTPAFNIARASVLWQAAPVLWQAARLELNIKYGGGGDVLRNICHKWCRILSFNSTADIAFSLLNKWSNANEA